MKSARIWKFWVQTLVCRQCLPDIEGAVIRLAPNRWTAKTVACSCRVNNSELYLRCPHMDTIFWRFCRNSKTMAMNSSTRRVGWRLATTRSLSATGNNGHRLRFDGQPTTAGRRLCNLESFSVRRDDNNELPDAHSLDKECFKRPNASVWWTLFNEQGLQTTRPFAFLSNLTTQFVYLHHVNCYVLTKVRMDSRRAWNLSLAD